MQVAATHTLKIALLLALHGEACHPSNGRSNNRVNLPWPNNKLGYGRYSSLRICLRNNLATAKQRRRIGWGPKSRLHTDVPVLDQQWPDGGRMKRHFGSVAVCPWETCARLSRVAGRCVNCIPAVSCWPSSSMLSILPRKTGTMGPTKHVEAQERSEYRRPTSTLVLNYSFDFSQDNRSK